MAARAANSSIWAARAAWRAARGSCSVFHLARGIHHVPESLNFGVFGVVGRFAPQISEVNWKVFSERRVAAFGVRRAALNR